jgi:uncharacterized small protein (DUF1192 family)
MIEDMTLLEFKNYFLDRKPKLDKIKSIDKKIKALQYEIKNLEKEREDTKKGLDAIPILQTRG